MALNVICPNCGHRQEMDDGFSRRKVRCPECGVLCPVPETSTAPGRKRSPAVEEETLANRLLDEVDVPTRKSTTGTRRDGSKPKLNPKAVGEPRNPDYDPDADDGQAYLVEGREESRCPGCDKVIEPETVLCVHCGLDFHRGKKVRRTYEPLARCWDLSVSLERRWAFFLLLSALGVVLAAAGTYFAGLKWTTMIPSTIVCTSMLCYMLGTFFRMELTRDRKGKVKLSRTWRIGFFPLAPKQIDLNMVGGVRTDLSRDVGLIDWMMVFILLPYGILPGILWWYHVIQTDRWNVVLTRDHGQSVELLYRGADSALASEVSAILRDAAGLWQETD